MARAVLLALCLATVAATLAEEAPMPAPLPPKEPGLLRVAQVRAYPVKGDLAANHAALMGVLGTLEGLDVDVVVTPECFLDGYVATEDEVTDLAPYAIDPETSEYSLAVSRWAAANHAWVVFGCTRRAADGVYNTALIYGRDGALVGMYDKLHIQTHDVKFTPGKSLHAFDSDFGRFGVMICADRRWPETARTLTLDGAKIVFNPTYGFHGDLNVAMMRTRAYENGVYVVFTHPGQSLITGPKGEVVRDESDEATRTSITDLDLSKAIGRDGGHIADRRPDVYRL